MDTASLAHRLWVVDVSDLESETLTQIAAGPGQMIGGTSPRTAVARRCRRLAQKGLAQYLASAQGGWPAGMWAAYPTCNGLNAMWRHAGDTHVGDCGARWRPDGTCSMCNAKRLLDLPAYERYLAALPGPDREIALSVSALWCNEHGYLRRPDITTQKLCRFSGSPLHTGLVSRVAQPAHARADNPAAPRLGST